MLYGFDRCREFTEIFLIFDYFSLSLNNNPSETSKAYTSCVHFAYINIDGKESTLKIVQYTIKSVLLIVFCSLAIACVIPTPEDVSSGFVETNDPAWFKFFSNDSLDYGRAFSYIIDGSYQDVFVSSEIIVKKNSCYIYSDYGMVLCAENNSWLALVIDTQQNYRVIKSVNGVVTRLIVWTYSGELVAGYAVLNILKVEQSSADNFDIYLNADRVNNFNEPGLVSDFHGYFAYVASENYENLDKNPVEVLYAGL